MGTNRKVWKEASVLVRREVVGVDVHVLVKRPDVSEILVWGSRAPLTTTHGGGVDDVGSIGNKV
jgi:hypothetical protein